MRRFLVGAIACVLFFPGSSVQAAKSRRVASAEQRWTVGGAGGSPEFIRDIMPLFSKLGCNNRNCHGSFRGQNGFRLSLFGSEPARDHKELLEVDSESEGDGPRADVKHPEQSLLLRKPTSKSTDDHGGGRRMAVGSWQYRMFRQWIADGARYDPKTSAKVLRFEVVPSELVFTDRGRTVPVRTVAWFSDGTSQDVTALSTFSSNDKGIATVSDKGEVSVTRTGDTAIIARYSSSVASAQVLVPAADDGTEFPPFAPHNQIDTFVAVKLRKLNIQPSDLCSDADFLRRAFLDVIGTLPTADEAREFLVDRDPDKRAQLIDRLLDRPEYARYWGMMFSDWTGNSKYISRNPMQWNWMWQQWIEDKLARNVSYDEFVYGFLCATSPDGRPRKDYLAEVSEIMHKTAGRYNYDDGRYARRRTNDLYWINVERRRPTTMALQTADAFLGLRLECAQCHNHPFDRWTQDDFEHFKSFFMLVRYCDPKTGKEVRRGSRGYGDESVEPGVLWRYAGIVRKIPPKLLGGKVLPYAENGPDLRIALWKWMRSADNPYFASSFVNRLWKHYLGIGIVDPVDDFSQGNPPSNPQLLHWLARDLIKHKFDMKHMHRLILNSRTYQLSWRPNASNRLDRRNFSHARLRRMPAEVLIDAVAQVTGVTDNFGRLPKGVPQRAVGQAMPPVRYSNNGPGYPMQIFGRPKREKTCVCERSSDPSAAQALYLINDRDIVARLGNPRGTLPRLLKATSDDREVIRTLYLTALSRYPTDKELHLQLDHLAKASSRAAGMKDVFWSLLNVREFILMH